MSLSDRIDKYYLPEIYFIGKNDMKYDKSLLIYRNNYTQIYSVSIV